MPPLTESDLGVVPKGKHWVDMADKGTVVVIEQPSGQTCAALGGIMATRMKVRGVEACIVGGRVRDLAELRKSGLPVSDRQHLRLGNCFGFHLSTTECSPLSSSIFRPWFFHRNLNQILRVVLGAFAGSLRSSFIF